MQQEELIEGLRQRDETALAALQRDYGALMRYIIAPILPDAQDREDCLSEVILRVWQKIGAYDEQRGSFSAWLTALTRNAARNRARSLEQTGELPEETPAPTPTPEEHVLAAETREALRQALCALPERDRALFYRKYYYLQPTRQIASELGLTERAVEGRLYRTKAKLRKALGGEDRG